jgi:hypothetical protein
MTRSAARNSSRNGAGETPRWHQNFASFLIQRAATRHNEMKFIAAFSDGQRQRRHFVIHTFQRLVIS